jgi:hypothetical protein
MKSIPIVLLIILVLPSISTSQPLSITPEERIPVCCHVTEADNEFSGLAKWRNYVLLIPQHATEKDVHQITAIDTLSIDSVLNHQSDSVYRYTTIALDTSLLSIIHTIQNAIGKHYKYGGFEAAVAIGDSLFFTVETDSLCYVVKGIIKEERNKYRVVFNPKDMLVLQKPNYRFANAGFESLAYLPASKQLIAFYENNNLPDAATGYSFNTDFSNKHSLSFNSPLLFRLTDITAIKDSAGNDALLGTNFFYNDFKRDTGTKITEFDYYLTGDTNKIYTSKQLSTAFAEMDGGNLLKDCFSRVISLHINGNSVSWKEEKVINYKADNWEGITPFKKGVLLIIDGKPPGVNCRLSYFELDKEP